MIQLFKDVIHAGKKARWFWMQYLLYALLIILTTVWSYLRLDFVRSYDAEQSQQIQSDDEQYKNN
ncbi:MAG: hypothetical protein KDK48_06510 [Chlamydiia bacterium]|nr:hypothetical protein [Chlamydiia bacterium]